MEGTIGLKPVYKELGTTGGIVSEGRQGSLRVGTRP